MRSERRLRTGGGEPETEIARAIVDDERYACALPRVIGIGRRVGGQDRHWDVKDVGRRWASHAARHCRQGWDSVR